MLYLNYYLFFNNCIFKYGFQIQDENNKFV